MMIKTACKKPKRALSALICQSNGIDLQFLLFSRLFEVLVSSVIDYEAEVWEGTLLGIIDNVQNRVLRCIGVNIHNPLTALGIVSQWLPARFRVQVSKITDVLV